MAGRYHGSKCEGGLSDINFVHKPSFAAAMIAIDMTAAVGNGDLGQIADAEKSNP